MHDPADWAGPRPAGAFRLWVCSWTVSHVLAGVAVGLGLGSCCGSGRCFGCSLGLDVGCCCSWRFSGYPSCVAPACCEASRPPPSCLAVLCLSSVRASWAGAALPTCASASTFPDISVIPLPHSMLSLWRSSDESVYPPASLSYRAIEPRHAPRELLAIWQSCI